MVKNVIIDLPENIIEEARANSYGSGSSLKEVVEKAIVDASKTAPHGRWVLEKILLTYDWAPSRITLWNMRRDARLVEGKDYKRKGKYVYYNKTRLEKLFRKNLKNPVIPSK